MMSAGVIVSTSTQVYEEDWRMVPSAPGELECD